jgi:glucan 1,3-beta-glucosidase
MTDLVFNGGNYGAFLGNQQYTTRNLTFNNCNTAIFMNWNWLWNLKSIKVNNCGVGIDMSSASNVGSVLLLDSTFTNTPVGVRIGILGTPVTGGTLILDNVDFTGSTQAVADNSTATVLAGGSKVSSWGIGREYVGSAAGSALKGAISGKAKPANLLNAQGAVFERSKPQYEGQSSSAFLSAKDNGAKGDGSTDDTAAIQALINKVAANPTNQIVYFDHGAYVVSSTIKVPKGVRITGEIWPIILASGAAFSDVSNPTPVFQVGAPGDTGNVEISDIIFETKGPLPGAVMVEWNIADPDGQQGQAGMWDVHFRIGGSAGTDLQSSTCSKNPNVTAGADPKCQAAFLLLHVTKEASIYLENTWYWVADHELDLADHNQINIYNGRGVLIESQKAAWLYGTSSEHSQLYNYQVANAKNVFMGVIQSETPYMQSNPNANEPFKANATWNDPDFSKCSDDGGCPKSWGLRVVDSTDVLVYGAGLYSFFDNYDQTCLETESCQENMVSIDANSDVSIFGLSTKAATNMVTLNGQGVISQKDNTNNFCSTVALFRTQ